MKRRSLFFLLLIFAVFQNFSEIKAQDKGNDDLIKVETSLVNIPVIVSDRQSRYISGLKVKDFTVYQDGKPQKIEFFANEEAPINVALMLDTSRSTQWVLDDIKDAAIDFIRQLRPTDHAMIVSFDRDVNVLSNLTSDKRQLENAIEEADIGERAGTVLNDAVSEVVNKNFAGVKGRKAIVLLTDGKDVGSEITKDDLSKQLIESDTMIYSVFYKTGGMNNRRRARYDDDDRSPYRRRNDNDDQSPYRRRMGDGDGGRMEQRQNQRNQRQTMKNEEATEFLQSIADMTAGRFYQNEVSDLNNVFASIADELRKQYVLGYYPDSSDQEAVADKVYQIKVKVDRNDLVVRAKNTYRKKTE